MSSASVGTPQVVPTFSDNGKFTGEWAVEVESTYTVFPNQGLAIARAWELVKDLDGAEVLILGEDGRVRASLTVRQLAPPIGGPEVDDFEDAALRAEALRITPSTARLRAGIARRLPVEGADLEADPADLY